MPRAEALNQTNPFLDFLDKLGQLACHPQRESFLNHSSPSNRRLIEFVFNLYRFIGRTSERQEVPASTYKMFDFTAPL